MDDSLPPGRREDADSVVISDSDDDDVVETSVKNSIYIADSSDGSTNVSRNITPGRVKRSPLARSSLTESAIKRRIKKTINRIISDDSEEDQDEEEDQEEQEDQEEAEAEEEEEEVQEEEENKRIEIEESNTTEEEEEEEEEEEKEKARDDKEEFALSFAKEEIGVGNIDPLVAQKRALLVCKVQQLENRIAKTRLLLSSANVDLLPDNGARLRESLAAQETELADTRIELENTPLVENNYRNPKPNPWARTFRRMNPQAARDEGLRVQEEESEEEEEDSVKEESLPDIPLRPKLSPDGKELGKRAQATFEKELALTVERLQDLHGSLLARPGEDERAEDPKGLKVKLMPHQQHALAWLLWREQQRPPGGVLADDMGLGKTLTMISLILASAAREATDNDNDSEEEWSERKKTFKHKGGTLVVCPASLLSQWEKEINSRCKKGLLSVEVYHGTNRENVPKRLAGNDVVITTYNILSREFKNNGTAYSINWKRVILDEAHVIRNHKSQASQAVCGLLASRRWALTGTPIQNKEMDLYSILKFLRCSPFDDLRVWKRWVDNKNAAGKQRLATVMKTMMLRRTKQELQAKGGMESLPEKFIEDISVKLDKEEQLVYEKVLIYSRTLFAQFLAQRAEKDHMAELGAGIYDRPTFLSNPNRTTQFTKAQNKLLSIHADVKSHEILVLLLRLRQICCHPALIHGMLDQTEVESTGIDPTDPMDPSLLNRINNITLTDNHDNEQDQDKDEEEGIPEEDIGIDKRVTGNLLTSRNPVFREDRVSSKMKAVLGVTKEILAKEEKLIIVSQWTSMLEVVAEQLQRIEGATFSRFNGSVPIKERQGIMDAFNTENADPRILLLSLTAGGVGLNLVGGNHLLLIDIHWNPQLETQAQDRIYRFGQRRNVYIYKFICKDTIEERIKMLQEKKLDIAQHVLTGDKSASKLTLNDLKSLFAL